MSDTEKQLDENWMMSVAGSYFYVGDILFINKLPNSAIRVAFSGNALNFTFTNEEDCDYSFDRLKERMCEYRNGQFNNYKRAQAIQIASAEIQNKIAGKFIHGGCDH